MYSEVFEEFVKIAQEKNSADSDRKKLENTRRHSSEEVKKLEELYNIKPEQLDGNYDNMVDRAHPETIVLSPAYDKPNGIIENLNERHSLIKEVIQKAPRGQHTNRRVHAHNELSLNLIRLGNDLDSSNKQELADLADACLNQMITKKAWLAIIPWILGGLTATLTLEKQLPNVNKGLTTNTKALLSELNDLTSSNSNFGIGTKYKREFIEIIKKIQAEIISFSKKYASEFEKFNFFQIQDAKQLLDEQDKLAETASSNKESLDDLFAATKNMIKFIDKVIDLFNKEQFIKNQIEDIGAITDTIESSHVINNITGLFNPFDDVNDVKKALSTYKDSLDNILFTLNGTIEKSNTAAQSIEKLLNKYPNNDSDQKTNESNPNDISFM